MTEHAYWCKKCEGWHWRHSKIGKRHTGFEVAEPLWLPEDKLKAWRKLQARANVPEEPCKHEETCKIPEFSGRVFPACYWGYDCKGILCACRKYEGAA